MHADGGNRVFSVSQITELIKSALEDGFPEVDVQGEISNFRPASSGHLYFCLKDRDAILNAVMFRGRADALPFTPADGMLVRARGSISVYARRGSYQILCTSLQRTGEGDILAMLEERKRRLASEGLFDPSRKRPLPLLPSRVAVVTSPTGAAIRDILRVMKRRNAGIDIVVLPSPVQGDGAEERIAAQIDAANRFRLGDVLIVGRGGGSLEDLLPFSAECVVRAIARSRIPVISAVGHEVDVTLSDLAADIRAPTPSAAAEIVAASREELAGRVGDLSGSLRAAMETRLERVRLLLSPYRGDALERNLRMLLQPHLQRFDDAKEGLLSSMRERRDGWKHRLELAARELASVSPLEVLRRGFSVVTLERTGKAVRSVEGVLPEDAIGIRVWKGRMKAVVKECERGGDEKL